jgi:D-glycero-alpha-D-manno-heptose-7-phosphate kinase
MIIRSRAPLRISFAGGGTDLDTYCNKYGGLVLNSTISLFVHCTIEESQDGNISFVSHDTNNKSENPSALVLPLNGNLDLYKVIYNRLVRDFIKKPLSFRLFTYSDVPVGSGLGGSSTLVVCIIKAFVEWLALPLGEYDIAKLAFEIERNEAGIIGGSQDQYASTFGGFNFMEFYDKNRVIINPLRIKNWILDELQESMLLYFTNISRKASQIEEEKKKLHSDKKALDSMHRIKENAIIMKEYLLKGDLIKFANLLGESWKSKKSITSIVSNQKIDEIYETAISNGAYSGKISGAGGGGFMFFLVDPVKRFNLEKKLNELGGVVTNFSFVKHGTKGWVV